MPSIEYTTTEVATRLGLTRQAVLAMVKRGELQPVRKLPQVRGPYLFAEQDVERAAAERAA